MTHGRVLKVAILAAIFSAAFIAVFFSLDIFLAALGATSTFQNEIRYAGAASAATLTVLAANQIGWRIYLSFKNLIIKLSPADFIIGIISVFIGLVMGALASAPLASIPDPWSWISSIVVAILATLAAIWAFNLKKGTLIEWTQSWWSSSPLRPAELSAKQRKASSTISEMVNPMVVDTSAIIDGRIKEIVRSGFLFGTLVIPAFVLEELQQVADSSSPEKRQRGRAGLKLLQGIRRSRHVTVRTVKTDYPEMKDVDAKIVRLALESGAKIITCDYNLNAVAKVDGIAILNVNELANYLKQLYLPGERISLKILHPGREDGQGIGFLPDGTMVVVQGGAKYVGRDVDAKVEKVLQTDAGRMLFCKFQKSSKLSLQ